MNKKLLFYFTLIVCPLQAIKLDRVILATNDNPEYIEFWPLVAKAWKEIVGIQPTLALIGDESVQVDESLGDVIRFAPIEGVSTGNYARTIRLLLPILFEDEVCLISDIDMLPLSKEYYQGSIADVPEDNFVVYVIALIRLINYLKYIVCTKPIITI